MRVSARGAYAVQAVLDLAVHHGEGLVPIQGIAARRGIPPRYLEQVLIALKRAGLVDARRGAAGGYQLTRAPAELTVGEVLRAVEGAGTPVAGGRVGRNGHEDDLAELWTDVSRAVASVVDRTTFATLVERVRRRTARPMYHI
jgi:Rrf2 family cysteine metabolism transcriptional repressor